MALLPREGPLAGMLREVDCPVEVIEPPPPLDRYGRRLAAAGGLTKIRAALALARYARTVSGWLRKREVDLLHCNQTRATVMAGPGGRLARAPVVWNVRIRERLPRAVVRLAAACSKLIIPLTEHDFQGLPDERRLLRKSTVIRNAVDTDRFTPDRDRAAARARLGLAAGTPVVLSVGVLVRRKGFDLLIRATKGVRQRVPGTKLLIAGQEPGGVEGAREELEALAAELGVTDAVTLLGQRDDVPELLAACDVFALASRHEGDPASVLEAMATARPVVVTPAAAAAVEDGRTGLVVPTDDAEALAEALASLLADPELRRELGRAGRAVVAAEHDMAAMVRAYEDAWESVLR
jgi:glycosyltransferase involved in cell wall biosynthesis